MSGNQLKFSFRGVLLLSSIFLIIVFLIAAFFIYNNLKSVEQNILNLREQMNSANTNLQDFTRPKLSHADIFKELTRGWEIYQNTEFGFQLKSPTAWGKITFSSASLAPGIVGKKITAVFDNLKESVSALNIITYDSSESAEKFASLDVKNALWQNNVGECKDVLFQKIKELNLGEVRNCFVRENIYGQRFLIYRYIQKTNEKVVEKLTAVFPRDNYYFKIDLPDAYKDEFDYFLESIIFL